MDELYGLLGVTVHAGSFEFRKPYKEIGMVFEGSVKGKVVCTASAGSMSTDPGAFAPGTCKYSVTVVDLDVLPLGGGHPGFCRVFVRYFITTGGGNYGSTDIAKADLDLTGAFNPPMTFGRRGREIGPDASGRTLVFQLIGGAAMIPHVGPDGKTTFGTLPSDKKLGCYFIGR